VQDLDVIDCIEKLRECVGVDDADAPAPPLRDQPPAFFAGELLRLHLGLDSEIPRDRRRLHMLLDKFTQAEADPAGAELIAEASGDAARPLSAQQARQVAAGMVFAMRGTLTADLAGQRNPLTAAAYIRRNMPSLGGARAYEYLVRIGYPAAVPSANVRRFFARTGLLDTGHKATNDRSFFEQALKIERLTGTPLPELNRLLGTFAGAIAGVTRPVCGSKPDCASCPITHHCLAFRHTGGAAEAPRPAIREWQAGERPRERLLAGNRLNDSELVAIILRTGSQRGSAVDLARNLLARFGSLQRLAVASPTEIAAVKDIGPAKAAQILAAIELGRRVADADADERMRLQQVGGSSDVFHAYRARFKGVTQEQFLVLALNNKNRVVRDFQVSLGTLNSSIVHPRDVFRGAIAESAAAVIFLHNHPSGDPTPSAEDRALTRRLAEAGKLIGIQVLDHVIVGAQRHYSFADEGELG
jgi:DNA repair protein RadC